MGKACIAMTTLLTGYIEYAKDIYLIILNEITNIKASSISAE
jgi:hypothetical protein